jgi:ferric-dicitrate binding protein FerR (iron transport regulator)
MGPIPHLTSPSASFSVEVTNTYSRISVYAGAVSVQNLNGTKTTVNLEAGFQSVVRLSGPPTKPTRFTIPLHPFWQ